MHFHINYIIFLKRRARNRGFRLRLQRLLVILNHDLWTHNILPAIALDFAPNFKGWLTKTIFTSTEFSHFSYIQTIGIFLNQIKNLLAYEILILLENASRLICIENYVNFTAPKYIDIAVIISIGTRWHWQFTVEGIFNKAPTRCEIQHLHYFLRIPGPQKRSKKYMAHLIVLLIKYIIKY